MENDNFGDMAGRWPSTVIARAEVKKFTGGGISAKTLANADSEGTGPKDRFFIGRRCCYPVSTLIEWLRQNTRKVSNKTNLEAREQTQKLEGVPE